jgi:hypothetical protein
MPAVKVIFGLTLVSCVSSDTDRSPVVVFRQYDHSRAYQCLEMWGGASHDSVISKRNGVIEEQYEECSSDFLVFSYDRICDNDGELSFCEIDVLGGYASVMAGGKVAERRHEAVGRKFRMLGSGEVYEQIDGAIRPLDNELLENVLTETFSKVVKESWHTSQLFTWLSSADIRIGESRVAKLGTIIGRYGRVGRGALLDEDVVCTLVRTLRIGGFECGEFVVNGQSANFVNSETMPVSGSFCVRLDCSLVVNLNIEFPVIIGGKNIRLSDGGSYSTRIEAKRSFCVNVLIE